MKSLHTIARPGLIVLRSLFFWFFLKFPKFSGALLRLWGVLMSVSFGHWGRCRQKVVWNYPRGFGMGVVDILFVMWYYQPLWLAHNKTGNCHYSLVSSPGSQVIWDLLDLFQQKISKSGLGELCRDATPTPRVQRGLRGLGSVGRGGRTQPWHFDRWCNWPKKIQICKWFPFFRFAEVLWPHSAELPRTKCDHVR